MRHESFYFYSDFIYKKISTPRICTIPHTNSAVRAINLGGYILVYQDISTWLYPGRLGYIQVDKSQLLGYIHVDISQSTRIYPPRYILVYQAIQVDLSQSTRIYLRGYILVDQDISTWINPSLLGYIYLDKSQSTRIYLGGYILVSWSPDRTSLYRPNLEMVYHFPYT